MSKLPPIVKLSPDNFTPPQRTPWGGTNIIKRLKNNLCLRIDPRDYWIVGESWEASTEPSFESEVFYNDDWISIGRFLEMFGSAVLGPDIFVENHSSLPILVKYIDAADDLSIQVHPGDDYPGLQQGETGKTEGWFIIDSKPGSGVFLGVKPGIDRKIIARALVEKVDIGQMLCFYPVEAGTYIPIPAGTIHAIGKGLTLLEIQAIKPRSKSITYRFWDWKRRYDEQGRPDKNGKPRELHIDDALACARVETYPSNLIIGNDQQFEGHISLAADRHFHFGIGVVERSKHLDCLASDRYTLIVCFKGSGRLKSSRQEISFACGETMLVPASCREYSIEAVQTLLFASCS